MNDDYYIKSICVFVVSQKKKKYRQDRYRRIGKPMICLMAKEMRSEKKIEHFDYNRFDAWINYIQKPPKKGIIKSHKKNGRAKGSRKNG